MQIGRSTRPHSPLLHALLAVVVVLAVASAPALSQDEPLSVAVVDLEILFVQSSFGKALQQELKSLEEDTRKKLEAKAKEAQDIDSQPVASLSETEIRALQRKREDLEIDARRIRDDAQRRAATIEKAKRTEFNNQMQSVFESIQTERNYDLILNKAGGSVIFAGEAIDITSDLLTRVGG